VNPIDAQHLRVQTGDWVEVRSRRGAIKVRVRATQYIRKGVVFMPMHWGFLWADAAECNAVTHPAYCPISLQPELKAAAVQLVAIAPPDPATAAATRTAQLSTAMVADRSLGTIAVPQNAHTGA
jgi:ferredoxin-nitrate reductase